MLKSEDENMELPLSPPIFALGLTLIGYCYVRYSAAQIDKMEREAEEELRRPATPAE